MWYQTIPALSVSEWLSGVAGLFSDIVRAVLGQSVLAAFLGVAVLLLAVNLFTLIYKAGKGRS